MKKLTLSVLQLIFLSGVAQLALAKEDFCQEAAEIIKTTINTQTMEVTPYSYYLTNCQPPLSRITCSTIPGNNVKIPEIKNGTMIIDSFEINVPANTADEAKMKAKDVISQTLRLSSGQYNRSPDLNNIALCTYSFDLTNDDSDFNLKVTRSINIFVRNLQT